MKKLSENQEDVIVFCLKCEKKQKTTFKHETSCLQCICCVLCVFTGPFSLVPFYVDSCKEKEHVCSQCESVLYHEEPGEPIQTQWEEEK
mmetsp:Transcript_3695/g.6292  ORF Transcript_3695/g.6292 Transcript_3695/m.6292 type:complete len:89 (+) Transcript_3695:408-674(+)